MSDSDQDTTADLDALESEFATLDTDPEVEREQDEKEADQQQQKKQLAGAITQFLGMTHNGIIAPRAGEHWKMSQDEAEAHGDAWVACLEKWFPDFEVGPELTLVGLLSMSYGSRIMAGRKAKAKQSNEESGTDEVPAQEPLGDPV